MYCFSQICRICLGNTTDLINLQAFDYNKIHEKLKFCVPEIIIDDEKLPDKVCKTCQLFLEQMYKFKHMCIENTNTLYKHVLKMSDTSSNKSNLYVAMNSVEMEQDTDHEIEVNANTTSESEGVSVKTIEGEDVSMYNKISEGVSMYSISLNQWDLFETKYTCRCIKEYGSFTEETNHLCKNCKGDLHGFRLSKIKVDIAQNRYNDSLTPSQLESDDNTSNYSTDVTSDKKYERGFDYNDILLCKVHVNGVNKQINVLNSVPVVTKEEHEEEKYIPTVSLKKKRRYCCTLCDKSYTRKYNLHNHFATHEESRFYYCKICNKKFITEKELKEHEYVHRRHTISEIKTEPSPKRRKLNEPDSSFDMHNFSLQEIKPDLNSSDENLICATCDKIFNHKSHLAIHLLTHVGKKEFKCTECSKEFFREDNFIEHKKIHKVNRKFECDQCEKSYQHLSNLRRHQHSHGGQYLCSICNQKFTEKDVLEEHIFATHTKPKPPKIFSCTVCEKTFSHIDHLKTHELFTHSKSTVNKNSPDKKNLYPCKHCTLTFTRRSNLETHERTHLTNKDKKKGRVTPSKIKMEEGAGQYCPICDRMYSIKTNIRKHLQTHSSGKIMHCSICKQEFTNMYLLREHIKTHDDYHNFKCHLCDKSYLNRANLNRHIDSYHSKKSK